MGEIHFDETQLKAWNAVLNARLFCTMMLAIAIAGAYLDPPDMRIYFIASLFSSASVGVAALIDMHAGRAWLGLVAIGFAIASFFALVLAVIGGP